MYITWLYVRHSHSHLKNCHFFPILVLVIVWDLKEQIRVASNQEVISNNIRQMNVVNSRLHRMKPIDINVFRTKHKTRKQIPSKRWWRIQNVTLLYVISPWTWRRRSNSYKSHKQNSCYCDPHLIQQVNDTCSWFIRKNPVIPEAQSPLSISGLRPVAGSCKRGCIKPGNLLVDERLLASKKRFFSADLIKNATGKWAKYYNFCVLP